MLQFTLYTVIGLHVNCSVMFPENGTSKFQNVSKMFASVLALIFLSSQSKTPSISACLRKLLYVVFYVDFVFEIYYRIILMHSFIFQYRS